jgi:oligopeptide/dipeptide ABC transporter ATP-binding protein
VDGVSFRIAPAECVALVGESGSGKSVTAQALIRLNPHARIDGRVTFGGRNLLELTERELADFRGARIGMAFQDAMTALNPIMPIGTQIMETLRIRGVGRKEARERAIAILTELGVAHAAERLGAYVHEFSGGMRQRVVLAMALIGAPDLLIADEPTTALDVRVQEQVLDVLDEFAASHALSVLLITHDLGIVASFADRVLVMYSGRVVEDSPINAIFAAPMHPYTIGLLAAVPRVDRNIDRLMAVPGTPVAPANRPEGCTFHPRCPFAVDRCRATAPELEQIGERRVACHRARELFGRPRAV